MSTARNQPVAPPTDEHTANDWMAERINNTGTGNDPAPTGTPLPTGPKGSARKGQAEESKRGSHN